MSKTITLSQFAHDLGAHQRITREVSLVWHKQWLKATHTTRTALRDEFMTHFTIGMLSCTQTEAVRILTKAKGERTKAQQDAYMAASQKFKYHISRDGAKSAETQQASHRISKHLRESALAFLAEFEGDTLDEQIKQALTVLRAL